MDELRNTQMKLCTIMKNTGAGQESSDQQFIYNMNEYQLSNAPIYLDNIRTHLDSIAIAKPKLDVGNWSEALINGSELCV